MARTKENDPEAVRKIAEPIIFDAVTREIGKRELQTAQGAADLTLTYCLLLSTNMTAQTMGQFLPATTGWGLPPFVGATQSLKVRNQGSLVLEFSARGTVVRRGLAQPKMKFDATPEQREALLREPAVTCCAASRRRHDRDR